MSSRNAGRFSKTVKAFAVQVEEDLQDTMIEAADKILTASQVPVARGGPMPYDTGELAGSLSVGVNKAPPRVRGVRSPFAFRANLYAAKLGDKINIAWTAKHAVPQEYGANGQPARGFARKAAMRWADTVKTIWARKQHR